MSEHSHSHAPGESHSHSHGPPQPPQQQQRALPAPPDPAIQALIDAQYMPVDLKLDGAILRCTPHSLVICKDCNVNFLRTSQLSSILVANPNIVIPPPANVSNKTLSVAVTRAKEEGNTHFKNQRYDQAVIRYTVAANIALQRAPWEQNGLLREELSTILSNRSASFAGYHDWISALADAEAVLSMRRNWPKAYLRKAKALRGLVKFDEALDTIEIGLSFEADNKELLELKTDVEKLKRSLEVIKAAKAISS